jgi:hypothetical protein
MRLGFAQLREFGRDVGHRAVVLAQLFTAAGPSGRRRVSLRAQHVGEGTDPVGHRPGGVTGVVGRPADQLVPVAGHQLGRPALGEPTYRELSTGLGQKSQRGDRQIVVAVPEPDPAGLGEQVQARRPTSAARTSARRLPGRGLTLGDHHVEVTAHSGRAQLQLGRHVNRGDGASFQQQPGYRQASSAVAGLRAMPVAHARLSSSGFHNTSVAYFGPNVQIAPP